MKRTVLIGMLFILIPFCAMAMEPDPGCGDAEGETHPTIGGECGDSFHPKGVQSTGGGGEAFWHLFCCNNKITIAGFVKDTKADGKSPRIRVECPNGTYFFYNKSGSGTYKNFSKTCTGSWIKAYLE